MNTPANSNGRERPLCGALKRDGSGETCRMPAGHGTPTPGVPGVRCKRHGGCTPTQQTHARRLEAQDAAVRFGIPVETTATDALLDELAMSRGILDFVRAQLRRLDPESMVYGTERVTRRRNGQVTEDTTVVKSRENVWWGIHDRAQKHHALVAAEVARLDIESRRVRLAEEQAVLFYQGILRVLGDFGIGEDDERIPVIIPRVMGELVPPEQGDGDAA